MLLALYLRVALWYAYPSFVVNKAVCGSKALEDSVEPKKNDDQSTIPTRDDFFVSKYARGRL